MKTISRIITATGLIAATAIIFPLCSTAASTYNLASPIPGEVSLPHVIQGRQAYAGQHIMWKDPDGHINIINSFGGADVAGNNRAYIHYINTFTGAHALIEGGACSFGRNSVYDPVHNKFYWYGEYCQNGLGGSFNEFDPVTMRNNVIQTGVGVWNSGQSIALGGDNRIYFTPMNDDYWQGGGAHLYSYDPAVGASSWKDYGVIYGPTNGNSPDLAVDTGFIYVAWQKQHLMVHPIGSGAWSELSFPGTTTNLTIHMEEGTKKWFLSRSTDGGNTWQSYWLQNGGATLITGTSPSTGYLEGLNMTNYIGMMSYGDYNGFTNAFDYDMNWDYGIPTPSNPTSTVYYGPHSTWNYPTSGFSTSTLNYTGPFYDLDVGNLVPHSGSSSFYAISDSVSNYNYTSKTSTPVYFRNVPSVYYAMRVPADHSSLNTEEVYLSGYANQAWRWNPALPWSTTNPKNITPSQHMNYRVFMDYDSEGKVWIGSNYCGATTGCKDFGSVAWYDPRNNTNGEMFADAWKGGNPGDPGYNSATEIKYTNLAMSNNRTKVVVSSNDGKLTVINALAKTIEGTYNLGMKAFMVEVADDQVMGVVSAGAISPTDPAKVFLFRPSTRTMIKEPQSIGVSGNPFGSADGSRSRVNFKLEKGPDGYAWLYVDNKIYRVNPTTLAFELVATDTSGSNKLKWADNNQDLILYGGTNTSYYPNLLTASQAFSSSDLNEDSAINLTDFNILKSDFLKLTANLANPKSDIDGDGQATIKDVGILMGGWK